MKRPIPFGNYYLMERVAVGGMAEVFKAKRFGAVNFEKTLALKRILPNIAEDKEFITMFIDEANIAVLLTHANIAQIYELGEEQGSYFIAMEYVEGKDLRTIFERMRRTAQKTLLPQQAAFIMARVCAGLNFAHHKKDRSGRPLGIVHRDVSPQNILVSYEGEVKVIDFGVAKAQNKAGHTQAGILKGKFAYMSPEQVQGLPLDHRSDVFGTGIVLHEMLTGKRLFVGDSDFQTLEKIRLAEAEPPSLTNPQVPPDLDAIVMKALSRDVDSRYQTAMEMHDDLQRFLYMQKPIYSGKNLSQYMQQFFDKDIQKEKVRAAEYESFFDKKDTSKPIEQTPTNQNWQNSGSNPNPFPNNPGSFSGSLPNPTAPPFGQQHQSSSVSFAQQQQSSSLPFAQQQQSSSLPFGQQQQSSSGPFAQQQNPAPVFASGPAAIPQGFSAPPPIPTANPSAFNPGGLSPAQSFDDVGESTMLDPAAGLYAGGTGAALSGGFSSPFASGPPLSDFMSPPAETEDALSEVNGLLGDDGAPTIVDPALLAGNAGGQSFSKKKALLIGGGITTVILIALLTFLFINREADLGLEEEPGRVKLRMSKALTGLQFYLNEKKLSSKQLKQVSPTSFEVVIFKEGLYTLKVKKEGYATIKLPLQISPGGELSTLLRFRALRSALSIQTSPKKAHIEINGKVQRKLSPYSRRLFIGTYKVRILKQGYKPIVKQIVLRRGKGVILKARLKKSKANLNVSCNSGSIKLSIASKRRGKWKTFKSGKTPFEVTKLDPKKTYKLTYTLNKKKKKKSIAFPLDPNVSIVLPCKKEKKIVTGTLHINTSPKAKVLLNKKEVGITPFKKDIAIGKYEIELVNVKTNKKLLFNKTIAKNTPTRIIVPKTAWK